MPEWNIEDLPEQYSDLDHHLLMGVKRYIEEGDALTHFTEALFANDLQGVFAHADKAQARQLRNWVQLVYNRVPSQCWGSYEKIETWRKSRRMEAESGGDSGVSSI